MTSDLLVPVVREGEGPPIFFAPSAGSTFFPLVKLARSLKNRRPFYVLDFVAMQEADPAQTGVEDISKSFLAEIRDVQGRGPYCLGGHCWGGTVALDVAAQLEAQGETVDMLILLESLPPLQDRARGEGGSGPGAELEKVLNPQIAPDRP
jgi:thioesterase domain-containing protein